MLRRRGASRADHVYRFNKAASLGLLGPLSPIRQFAISVVTNRYPLNILKDLKVPNGDIKCLFIFLFSFMRNLNFILVLVRIISAGAFAQFL